MQKSFSKFHFLLISCSIIAIASGANAGGPAEPSIEINFDALSAIQQPSMISPTVMAAPTSAITMSPVAPITPVMPAKISAPAHKYVAQNKPEPKWEQTPLSMQSTAAETEASTEAAPNTKASEPIHKKHIAKKVAIHKTEVANTNIDNSTAPSQPTKPVEVASVPATPAIITPAPQPATLASSNLNASTNQPVNNDMTAPAAPAAMPLAANEMPAAASMAPPAPAMEVTKAEPVPAPEAPSTETTTTTTTQVTKPTLTERFKAFIAKWKNNGTTSTANNENKASDVPAPETPPSPNAAAEAPPAPIPAPGTAAENPPAVVTTTTTTIVSENAVAPAATAPIAAPANDMPANTPPAAQAVPASMAQNGLPANNSLPANAMMAAPAMPNTMPNDQMQSSVAAPTPPVTVSGINEVPVTNTPTTSSNLASLSQPQPVMDQASLSAKGLIARVVYDQNSTDIPASSSASLDQLATSMQASADQRVTIISYATSNDGQPSTARRTSLKRALSVRKYLIDKGIDSSRINVQAMGDSTSETPIDRVDISKTGNS